AGVLARHPVDEREVLVGLDVDDAAADRQPVPGVLGADDRDGRFRPLPEGLPLARADGGAGQDVLAVEVDPHRERDDPALVVQVGDVTEGRLVEEVANSFRNRRGRRHELLSTPRCAWPLLLASVFTAYSGEKEERNDVTEGNRRRGGLRPFGLS